MYVFLQYTYICAFRLSVLYKNIITIFLFLLYGGTLLQAKEIVNFSLPFNSSQNGYIVPFTLKGGLMIVEAKINDSIGNFVIDTGAEGLVLNSRHFRGTEDESRRFYGVSGRGKSLRVSRNNRMLVDAVVYENVAADVIDLSSIENQKSIKIAGLIGFSLLKDFEIMFNYRERYLSLSRLDENGQVIDPMPFMKKKADSLAFVFGNFIPVIDVKVNGIPKKFGIDTGAEINLLDLKRSKDVMSMFTPMRTISLAGSDNTESEVLAGRLLKVVLLEKYRCAPMGTILVSMGNLNAIYRTNLDGILGFEFLSPWLFSINYKKQLLYLHPLNVFAP